MFYSDVAGLSAKELNKKKKELQTGLFEARMKNTLGQLANQMTIREARRDIARINTALTAQAKGQAKPAPANAAKTNTKAAGKKTAARGKKG